jgi:hypothetical protein
MRFETFVLVSVLCCFGLAVSSVCGAATLNPLSSSSGGQQSSDELSEDEVNAELLEELRSVQDQGRKHELVKHIRQWLSSSSGSDMDSAEREFLHVKRENVKRPFNPQTSTNI